MKKKDKTTLSNCLSRGRHSTDMVAFTVIILWLVGATCFVSCGHDAHHDEHGHEHEEAIEAGHTHEHSDEIVLEAHKAKEAGVEVERVEKSDFHGVIHTTGSVMAASCDETTVVATTNGRIGQSGHISEGMHINNGMMLFTITSAEMQVEEGDPIQHARIAYERAKREYERAEMLVADQLVSEKDFQLSKSEYEASKLTYEAIKKNRSAGGIVINAPRAGYVKQNLVKEGDYVEAGQPLMIITQNQHLYLRAEVSERYWKELSHITCAKFRTSYSDRLYDITDMGGHVQSYAHSSTGGNAYLPIIFEFNNTGDVIQGSYAEVYLITDSRHDALTVPLSALTEEQGLYYIYIRVDEDGYRKQLVSLGTNDGERVEITQGLKGGEDVVVRGAMQVKLASASNTIPAHTHNH